MTVACLEIYSSKWKMLASLLFLWGSCIFLAILSIEFGIGKGVYKDNLDLFRMCGYPIFLFILIYYSRLPVKKIFINSRNFPHGKPIYRIGEDSIEFLDVFKFNVKRIRGIQNSLMYRGGVNQIWFGMY
jgi:hypothetical protein